MTSQKPHVARRGIHRAIFTGPWAKTEPLLEP
jgi:hypothetical protein